jgi:MraZ protein
LAFRGTFDFTLDAKNRLTVPARFRAQLSDGVVLAKAFEPCVSLWTPAAYDAYQAAVLGDLNPASPDARKLAQYFSANAVDSELDAAGRVMVPSRLLAHGSLSREVVVTGAGDHLQIWDRGAWDSYNDQLTDRVQAITEALGNAS